MSSSKSIFAFVGLTLVVLAAGQERRESGHKSLGYGLQGPVHTQLAISKKLNEDPRSKPFLQMRGVAGWLEFAADGELIGRGDADEPGKITGLTRIQFNPVDNSTVTMDADGKVLHRIETSTSKDGKDETKIFTDGTLTQRFVSARNPQTGDGESTNYDAQGNVTGHSITHSSPTRRESEIYRKDGTLLTHSVQRFDEKHALIESLQYDAEGKLVSNFSFKEGVLTSWWQDPKCNCTNTAFLHKGDQSTMYLTTRDGALRKRIVHQQIRPFNHELSDEELYDESDHLLERIAYAYEWDSHNNWTKRTVSVLDPKTNAMVPVREDTRTLTYY